MNNANFKAICEKAHEAGCEAVKTASIRPMIVGQETFFMSGKIDPATAEFVEDGVCGFAWVDVYPKFKGNTKLGKEERAVLEKNGFRKNEYRKCYYLWVSDYNQSMQKKEAYAYAYAKILRDNGITAYSGSRMD